MLMSRRGRLLPSSPMLPGLPSPLLSSLVLLSLLLSCNSLMPCSSLRNTCRYVQTASSDRHVAVQSCSG